MGYYEFPHTRNYDTDLGYLIKRYFELSTDFESLEKNFNDLKAWCIAQLNSEALKTLVANKLDEWLQDGTLEALINNPLNHVTTYDTVVEMLPHSGLLEGSKIYCTGADSVNDGKGGHFRIRARLSTDVIDNYNLYLIDGGVKVAERLDHKLKDRNIILIGDSWGCSDEWGNFKSWATQLIEFVPQYDFTRLAESAAGFARAGQSGHTFKGLLELYEGVKTTVTDIVVVGGSNDRALNQTDVENAIIDFINYAKTNFAKAKIHIGFCGYVNTMFGSSDQLLFNNCYLTYSKCQKHGAAFIPGLENITRDFDYYYNEGHMNEQGMTPIAEYLASYLISGSATYSIRKETLVTLDEALSTVSEFAPTVIVDRHDNISTIEVTSNNRDGSSYGVIFVSGNNIQFAGSGLLTLGTLQTGLIHGVEYARGLLTIDTYVWFTIDGVLNTNTKYPAKFVIVNGWLFLQFYFQPSGNITEIRIASGTTSVNTLMC